MDSAATLSFFQSFYGNTPLYVGAASTTPQPASVAPGPGVAVEKLVPATPPAAPAPPPTAPPTATADRAPLPVLGNLKPAAPGPALPPPVAAAPPQPPVAVPAPVPAAADAAPSLFTTLSLAELPAAAVAPPPQAGRIQPTPTQSPVAHVPFATLGSNAQGLLILVRLAPDQFRKLPRNVFLNKLLQAIGLVMADVVLVNVEHDKYPVALCSLRQHLHARQFLAFGKNLLDVAVYTTQPYEPVLLYGDTAYLGAGEVEMLEYDAGRKKQLWQAIQRMFLQ